MWHCGHRQSVKTGGLRGPRSITKNGDLQTTVTLGVGEQRLVWERIHVLRLKNTQEKKKRNVSKIITLVNQKKYVARFNVLNNQVFILIIRNKDLYNEWVTSHLR